MAWDEINHILALIVTRNEKWQMSFFMTSSVFGDDNHSDFVGSELKYLIYSHLRCSTFIRESQQILIFRETILIPFSFRIFVIESLSSHFSASTLQLLEQWTLFYNSLLTLSLIIVLSTHCSSSLFSLSPLFFSWVIIIDFLFLLYEFRCICTIYNWK